MSGKFKDAFFTPTKSKFCFIAVPSTFCKRTCIALCEFEAIPTFFPWRRSSIITLALMVVLPVPGGPWIDRQLS